MVEGGLCLINCQTLNSKVIGIGLVVKPIDPRDRHCHIVPIDTVDQIWVCGYVCTIGGGSVVFVTLQAFSVDPEFVTAVENRLRIQNGHHNVVLCLILLCHISVQRNAQIAIPRQIFVFVVFKSECANVVQWDLNAFLETKCP